MPVNSLQKEAKNKLKEWFDAGLNDWDISRDSPYFGFKIPEEENKYFYVWLDAPIGYMASFKNLCDRENLNFDAYWKDDKNTELYNFIGKDILYLSHLVLGLRCCMERGFESQLMFTRMDS